MYFNRDMEGGSGGGSRGRTEGSSCGDTVRVVGVAHGTLRVVVAAVPVPTVDRQGGWIGHQHGRTDWQKWEVHTIYGGGQHSDRVSVSVLRGGQEGIWEA